MLNTGRTRRWRIFWTSTLWFTAILSWVVSFILSVATFATNDYTRIIEVALAFAALHMICVVSLLVTTQTRWRFALLLLSALLAAPVIDDLGRLSVSVVEH